MGAIFGELITEQKWRNAPMVHTSGLGRQNGEPEGRRLDKFAGAKLPPGAAKNPTLPKMTVKGSGKELKTVCFSGWKLARNTVETEQRQ